LGATKPLQCGIGNAPKEAKAQKELRGRGSATKEYLYKSIIYIDMTMICALQDALVATSFCAPFVKVLHW
jgi:hypothetical protein